MLRFPAPAPSVAAWFVFFPLFALVTGAVQGQDLQTRPEFSLTVELPETRNAAKNLLNQVDQHLQQKNWIDAIDTLARLHSDHGDELIAQGEDQVDLGSQYTYYVSLKRYLQRRVSQFSRQAPEFLETYRERIDPLARQVLNEARTSRDIAALAAGIETYFLSSYTDQALLSLGDLLLEQGRFNEARTAWERISPRFRTPEDPRGVLLAMPGQPLWVAVDGIDWEAERQYVRARLEQATNTSPLATVPDSQIDPAQVWARLCLASWLEGAHDRAAVELELLKQIHPDAQGHLGGREVNYQQFLTRLLKTPEGTQSGVEYLNWPTFAGNYERDGTAKAPPAAEMYRPLWSTALDVQSLSRAPRNASPLDESNGPISLVAETADRLLSAFPVVISGNVLVSDGLRVRAFQLETGLPAFPTLESRVRDHSDPDYGAFHSISRRDVFHEQPRRRGRVSQISQKLMDALGASRFTLSGEGNMAVARVGTTVIGVTHLAAQFQDPADMVVFDLSKEGKMEARIPPVTELSGPWAFEGTAILRGNRLYCGMTKGGVRDESAVACFDWTTAQMLWRRTISLTQPYGSGLVADGDYGQRSHNLLSMKDGVLYYNTNHGVIAAIEAERGNMLWVTRYPRRTLTPSSLEEAHAQVQRDVNPCIVTQGLVVAMPTDSDRMFALDAATGQFVWQTVPGGINPVHLLGTSDDDVLVSGDQLFWVHLHSGKIRGEFPAADRAISERAHGRGVLVEGQVFWPTRDSVYRLQASLGAKGQVEEAAPPLDLAQFGEEGGNLLVAGKYLVVAAPDRLTVFTPVSTRDSESPRKPTRRPTNQGKQPDE